jgi:hypothetical protein
MQQMTGRKASHASTICRTLLEWLVHYTERCLNGWYIRMLHVALVCVDGGGPIQLEVLEEYEVRIHAVNMMKRESPYCLLRILMCRL